VLFRSETTSNRYPYLRQMRVGFSIFWRLSLALAGCGLGAPVSCLAQTAPAQGQIPAHSPAGTNTNSLKAHNSLQQLEEALSKSFQSLAPRSTEETFTPPPYQPRPVSPPLPRDKKKDLFSFTVEEMLMPNAPGEDNLKLPGTKDDLSEKRVSWDQFYRQWSLSPTNSSRSSRTTQRDPTGRNVRNSGPESDTKDDLGVPEGVRDSEKKLNDLLNQQNSRHSPDTAPLTRSSFADIFEPPDTTFTPEQQKAHKDYMDKYRQLLDSTAPPGTLNPLNPLAPAESSQRSAPGTLGGLPGVSLPPPMPGTPAAMDALLNPTTLPDLNSKVLNAWNPFYVAPKIEPPKPAPLTVPTVQAPRRVF